MKAQYEQVYRWAKRMGIKIKKYSNGYYWYDSNNAKRKAKNIPKLISDINAEVSPVGTPQKIQAMIASLEGFMAFEIED